MAGLYLYLAAFLMPWAAAVTAGLVVLVLALLFLIICWLMAGKGPSRQQSGEETSSHQGGETVEMLLGLMQKSGISAKEASLIALLAGTMLGASPELRRKLFGEHGEGD